MLAMFLLGYYAVTKGLDIVIGVALVISFISNILNIMCMIPSGEKAIGN